MLVSRVPKADPSRETEGLQPRERVMIAQARTREPSATVISRSHGLAHVDPFTYDTVLITAYKQQRVQKAQDQMQWPNALPALR